MYKILSDINVLLGYTEKPNYIKYNNKHDLIPSSPVEAIGLNFKGVVYNLLGHSEIENAKTAYASMVTEAELNAMKAEADQQTTDLQLAMIELYESTIISNQTK